jgi:hypothetical protein
MPISRKWRPAALVALLLGAGGGRARDPAVAAAAQSRPPVSATRHPSTTKIQ